MLGGPFGRLRMHVHTYTEPKTHVYVHLFIIMYCICALKHRYQTNVHGVFPGGKANLNCRSFLTIAYVCPLDHGYRYNSVKALCVWMKFFCVEGVFSAAVHTHCMLSLSGLSGTSARCSRWRSCEAVWRAARRPSYTCQFSTRFLCKALATEHNHNHPPHFAPSSFWFFSFTLHSTAVLPFLQLNCCDGCPSNTFLAQRQWQRLDAKVLGPAP